MNENPALQGPRENLLLEYEIAEKQILALADALPADRETLAEAGDAALTDFNTRRVFLRMLVHLHEHMDQMIGYTRMNGLRAPWPDWRPDRR